MVTVEPKSPGISPRQLAFLIVPAHEALFGGAAGGGKSEVLLAGATQYVDDFPSSALLLRRTFRDLDKPGGLMFRARQWFHGTDAHWDGANHRWMFPSGASVNFGYLEHEGDELKYQSSEYQYIGFDELTHFPEHQYLYLFSRLRRLADSPVPLRMRGATNPGGPGHEWVRKRWQLPAGNPDDPDRVFVASFLKDNPFLDQEEYERGLELLGPVTKAQLLEGDWSATATGGYFDTSKFRILPWDDVPRAQDFSNVIRYWDLGTTEPTELNPDPDYTVGLKIGMLPSSPLDPKIPSWYVFDVDRFRGGPAVVEQRVKANAIRDGKNIPVWIEKELGAAGAHLVSHYARNVLPGHQVRGLRVQKTKEERAAQAAARVGETRVMLIEGEWIDDFVAECAVFPMGMHDDQVDTLGYGMISLEREAMLVSQGKVTRRGSEMQPVRRGRRAQPDRAVGW